MDFAIAHLTERQSVMFDTVLMTAAMQHAVGRATHDELRAELTRRIAAGDVIAEEPLYRLADDRDGSAGEKRAPLQEEVQHHKRGPIGPAVGGLYDSSRHRRLS